jgi:hypothetical protein
MITDIITNIQDFGLHLPPWAVSLLLFSVGFLFIALMLHAKGDK